MARRKRPFFFIIPLLAAGCSGLPEERDLPHLDAANETIMVYSDHVRGRIAERMLEHQRQSQNLADLIAFYGDIKANGPGWFEEDNAETKAFTRILSVMTHIQSLQVANGNDLFSVACVQAEEAIRLRQLAEKCGAQVPQRTNYLLLAQQYEEFSKQNIALGESFFKKARTTGNEYHTFLVQNGRLPDINVDDTQIVIKEPVAVPVPVIPLPVPPQPQEPPAAPAPDIQPEPTPAPDQQPPAAPEDPPVRLGQPLSGQPAPAVPPK